MQAIKNKHLTIIICSALIAVLQSGVLSAQRPSDLIEDGERLLKAGLFSEAAEKFERAGRIKSADPDLMLRAGDAYIQARDYRKSADCLSAARQEREKYPLASLRYARALKQCGRYDEAIDAFKKFSKQYRGERRAQLLDIARMEKIGCQLALDMLNQPPTDEPQPRLTRLPSTVNQAGNEYAPMSVMEGLLYFCMPSFEGKGKLYRTIFDDSTNNWSKYELASGLPAAVASRFGSGVLSPDGQRFYCTQCDPGPPYNRNDGSAPGNCQLVVVRRQADGQWGNIEKLPSYINLPGTSNIHPAIARRGDSEVLIFASNRSGGMGGFDLYLCERSLQSPSLDFSFPQNLGKRQNSAGDEISPALSANGQWLYFASNGRPGFGGMDIFQSIFFKGLYQQADNMAAPMNSPADDFFFYPKKGHSGGFFISNRLWGSQKTGTEEQDIYEITY